MKLTRDNFELVLFDLLEGNLSQSQELAVMEQIEGDEFYFQQWKLFKSTILIADPETTFDNKEALLKPVTTSAVVPMYARWIGIAAAVTVLALAVLWTQRTPDEIAESTESVAPESEEVVQEKEKVAPIDEIKESVVFTTTGRASTERTKRPIESQKNSPIPQVKEVERSPEEIVREIIEKPIPVEKPTKPQLPRIEKEQPIAEQVVEEIAQEDLTPKRVEDVVKPGSEEQPKAPESKKISRNLNAFVTNKPLQRIREKGNEFFAKARNPKLRFKPKFEDKRPSLDIEFESTGYSAMASIQPFKRN